MARTLVTSISAVGGRNLIKDVFSGNGVQKVFTLSIDPAAQSNTMVYVSGVYQNQDTYTLVGTTLTFSEAPPLGTNNIEVMSGEQLDINVPGNDTVSTIKIKDLNVTGAKLADGNVSYAKLASDVTNKFSAGYIANGSAEVDTAGWASYNDGAVAMPVDGTGGAATLTWTRSTSSPIRGVASFRLTKTAANSQGQGVSYPFTIEKADQAKVLTISFDYEVVSGTYADGDVTVYIYDVTNSQIIQPAGYTIQNVASGIENKHIATFQTSATGTSYRLVFHVASTSASAYVLGIDNVVVGPQTVQYGAPITDWVTETRVAWAGSLTSLGNGTAVYKSRRVGDSLEIEASLNVGSTTATTSTSALRLDLTGITIDGNKGTEYYGNSALGGSGYFLDSSTNIRYVLSPYRASTSQITFHSSANSNDVFKSGIPVAFASGDVVTVRALIPITGWSSSLQLSDSTDTRVVATRAFRSGTDQSIASTLNAYTKIQFNGASFDETGSFNTTDSRFSVPVPGVFKISGTVMLRATTATGELGIVLYKNGVQVSNVYGSKQSASSLSTSYLFVFYEKANAGDYFEIFILNATSSALSIAGSNAIAGGSYVNFQRISGPSTIAATETVVAQFGASTANLSVSGAAGAVIVWPSVAYDTHGCYNPSTGVYTVPVSGYYNVRITEAYTVTAGSHYLNLFKNGSYLQNVIMYCPTAATVESGFTQAYFNAGDLITIRSSSNHTIQYINQGYQAKVFIERVK